MALADRILIRLMWANDLPRRHGSCSFSESANDPSPNLPHGQSYSDEFDAGLQNPREINAIKPNIGNGAARFNFQRFGVQYVYAGNFGVGVFMRGAAWSLQEMVAIGSSFSISKVFTPNGWKSVRQLQVNIKAWIAGWKWAARNCGIFGVTTDEA